MAHEVAPVRWRTSTNPGEGFPCASPITDQDLVDVVADFVDEQVRPRVREFEPDDVYPEPLVAAMKELGVFGMLVPEAYAGTGLSTPTFAPVSAELARGWMSLAGAVGGHSVVAHLLARFGTDAQRRRYLPGMADGSLRATMALTEPGGGSDLQAMRSVVRRDGDDLVVTGSKTWISNARHAGPFALLCKTDPAAEPRHAGISVLLAEPGPGLEVSRNLPKLGYRGIEAGEVSCDGMRVPAEAVLGGVPRRGWAQMMAGLEVGRIQVAARAVGVAQAALDDAVRYSQERESFGRPIWQHQSVGNLLADMATRVRAARLLTLDALRVHGGAGCSREYDVERYYRDAPLMIVGEGTNEIQRGVMAAQLIARDSTRGRR